MTRQDLKNEQQTDKDEMEIFNLLSPLLLVSKDDNRLAGAVVKHIHNAFGSDRLGRLSARYFTSSFGVLLRNLTTCELLAWINDGANRNSLTVLARGCL